uniref:Uncharacterized protein n=1 Tax=Bubo bubo TaxID=30461 RepID=A0A8C0FN46_BUBBB
SLTNKERIGDELTTALEENPDDAEYYCQRAYAHILLQKYADAVADAKKSLELNPNNAIALLRKGLGEYHIKNYASALESFREGQRLDSNVANLCLPPSDHAPSYSCACLASSFNALSLQKPTIFKVFSLWVNVLKWRNERSECRRQQK